LHDFCKRIGVMFHSHEPGMKVLHTVRLSIVSVIR
jgi:hypothetical protein